jgi:hypothetical protein
MSRPLIALGIGQLEELFATANADNKVLTGLRDELQHRHVPRAIALLAKVTKAIAVTTISTPPSHGNPQPARVLESQPDLWEGKDIPSVPQPPVESRPPIDRAAQRPVDPSPQPTPKQDSALDDVADVGMTVDEAYKLLRVTPASTWEDIEFARRRLVQLAHPDALASLTPDQRGELVLKAGRANAASRALRIARSGRT